MDLTAWVSQKNSNIYRSTNNYTDYFIKSLDFFVMLGFVTVRSISK